ncbi:Iron-sulfur cluster carrier protein [Candidatus Hydrogenisulfobacillus filiaventi]|uniref:Iron-sulfur cluster carrier protein n=1 Tax=Candidatus Hydrogenisulfobacillus filiaventi TaxID=2707344 RepID=A0A6F8ZEB5_9FIRM|nr:Mrp/NBP35 family ATP-binding protein [Bacillota bacterium]CAB1128095.1 Iron-sulfur cluster carrier protein [Candidatus Hydrogenisulfobacillus filiaventi]
MPTVTKEAVLAALDRVEDPELKASIVALNMVRGIGFPAAGTVEVEIALTVAGCPLQDRIREDAERALLALPGVETVRVRLSVMEEEDRRRAWASAYAASQARAGARQAAPAAEGGGAPPKAPKAPVATGLQLGPIPGQDPWAGTMLDAKNPTTIIGVASGKGGVGKSTVTANLAVAVRRLGYRVGVMDMDVYGFSQGRMFGAHGTARVNAQQKILPWHVHDVSLVSMGMFIGEDQAVIWRGPMLGKLMEQFFGDVAWPELDYLFIDLPPGTGDVALDIAQRVRKAQLVLVTTPQEVATHVARRAADVARRAQQTLLGVIENMSYARCPDGTRFPLFGEGGGQRLADELKVPLLGQIPLETHVRESGDKGKPAVVVAADSEAGQAFLAIARKLVELTPARAAAQQ